MKKIIISTIVSALLAGSTSATTLNSNTKNLLNVKNLNNKSVIKAQNHAFYNQKKLVQEALDSLVLANEALININKGDNTQAKVSIEKALGKLEVILSAKNGPKLLDVENRIDVKNFIGTSKDVKNIIDTVKDLLEDGKVQIARKLLNTLQSQLTIESVNLPLVSYPDALKLASKYLLDNQSQKAKSVLEVALSTFTIVKQIIPIPLINATDLIHVASNIEKDNKKDALLYLDAALEELSKAQALGYISDSSVTYKELNTLIKGLQKEIKGPNDVEKLFNNLSKKLKEFKNKILSKDTNSSK